MISEQFGGDDWDGYSFFAVIVRGVGACGLDRTRGLNGARGLGFGGGLLFLSGLFQCAEHEGGEMADGSGGRKIDLTTAELVDGID